MLVLTALSMVVLIGMAALAVDLSLAMNERRTAQNAADHAALSAAWADCTGGDATTAANASVVENGYTAGELTLTNLGGSEFEAVVDTNSDTFFARVIGFNTVSVSTEAVADCLGGGGGGNAIFALGDTCSSYGKEQLDISGSTQTVYGGIHSNDNADISGSSNDFGPGDPGVDPFTYVTTLTEGGSGNGFDPGFPDQVGPLPTPITFSLGDYDPGSPKVVGLGGQYHYITGDIDGDYIQSNGSGLYYATGDIKLDKTVNLDVTLVAEGVVEISGSNQVIDPFIDNLLLFGGQPYTGIDQCDKFVVSMGGSTQTWTGIIYGPDGLIEMNGSSNTTLTGSLIGYSVRLNGSNLTIINDPSLFGGSPYVVLNE